MIDAGKATTLATRAEAGDGEAIVAHLVENGNSFSMPVTAAGSSTNVTKMLFPVEAGYGLMFPTLGMINTTSNHANTANVSMNIIAASVAATASIKVTANASGSIVVTVNGTAVTIGTGSSPSDDASRIVSGLNGNGTVAAVITAAVDSGDNTKVNLTVDAAGLAGNSTTLVVSGPGAYDVVAFSGGVNEDTLLASLVAPQVLKKYDQTTAPFVINSLSTSRDISVRFTNSHSGDVEVFLHGFFVYAPSATFTAIRTPEVTRLATVVARPSELLDIAG